MRAATPASASTRRPRAFALGAMALGAMALGVMTLVLAGCEGITVMDAGRPIDAARPSTADTLATGTFTGRERQSTAGRYALVRVGTDLQIHLDDAFRTDPGPDLHVVLTPTSAATVSGNTALAAGAVAISRLTALTGQQAYDVPDTLALGRFNAVLVHCVRHAHLYGAAPLVLRPVTAPQVRRNVLPPPPRYR